MSGWVQAKLRECLCPYAQNSKQSNDEMLQIFQCKNVHPRDDKPINPGISSKASFIDDNFV